jgi:hypothetical protein
MEEKSNRLKREMDQADEEYELKLTHLEKERERFEADQEEKRKKLEREREAFEQQMEKKRERLLDSHKAKKLRQNREYEDSCQYNIGCRSNMENTQLIIESRRKMIEDTQEQQKKPNIISKVRMTMTDYTKVRESDKKIDELKQELKRWHKQISFYDEKLTDALEWKYEMEMHKIDEDEYKEMHWVKNYCKYDDRYNDMMIRINGLEKDIQMMLPEKSAVGG